MRLTGFLVFSLLLFAQANAYVQAGVLWGQVTDAETGDAIEGVSVYLMHTLLGSATTSNGMYAIEAVPEGTYTLVVSMIGYASVQYEVEINPGSSPLRLDHPLMPEVYELNAVGVTAERPRKWKRRFDTFNKLFLGTMPFEEEARLLNHMGSTSGKTAACSRHPATNFWLLRTTASGTVSISN